MKRIRAKQKTIYHTDLKANGVNIMRTPAEDAGIYHI